MWQIQLQANFFCLYAKLLCYIISVNSLVSYIDKYEYNSYYKEITELNITTSIVLTVTNNRYDRYMRVW